MLKVEIHKEVECNFSKKFFVDVIRKTFAKSKINFHKKKVLINIIIVSPLKIRKINREHRKKDKITDILSFSYLDEKKFSKKDELFLGEIFICCNYIKKSAKINKTSIKEEMAYVVSHGALHLLGFSHGEKMFSIQEEVSNKI